MIRAISPPFASLGDRFTFEIYGDVFTGATGVTIGPVIVVSFQVLNDGLIRGRARVPDDGARGAYYDVEVTTPTHQHKLHQGFQVL